MKPDQIRQLRRRLRMDQREFAKLLRAHHTTISHLETGKRLPGERTKELLKRISKRPMG